MLKPGVGDLDRSRAEDAGPLTQARERHGIGALGEAGTVTEANGLPRGDLDPPAAERKVESANAHVGPRRNRIAAEVHFKGLSRERDVEHVAVIVLIVIAETELEIAVPR